MGRASSRAFPIAPTEMTRIPALLSCRSLPSRFRRGHPRTSTARFTASCSERYAIVRHDDCLIPTRSIGCIDSPQPCRCRRLPCPTLLESVLRRYAFVQGARISCTAHFGAVAIEQMPQSFACSTLAQFQRLASALVREPARLPDDADRIKCLISIKGG